MLAAVVSVLGLTVEPPFAAPAASFDLQLSDVPNNTQSVTLLALATNAEHTLALAAGASSVSGASLPAGLYAVVANGVAASQTVRLHDGYSLSEVMLADGSGLDRLSVAGGTGLRLRGSGFFESSSVVLRFTGALAGSAAPVEIAGQASADGDVTASAPAWTTPGSWWQSCNLEGGRAPVRSASCVPDMSVQLSVSLDAGVSFSNSVAVTYGWVRPLKLAFAYMGPITDFGWTFANNKGRLYVESRFGGLVDATEYAENVPEGEFVTEQANKSQTLATGTEVLSTFPDGSPNAYHPLWARLQRYCDEDFDLVFTTSFGFMAQTLDVAAS